MRIITGCARGTKLKTPSGMNTRPTADRIKESLFNILQNDIIDTNVLDIFAGSGALGLETLSRGAASAVFIDKSADSIAAIEYNVQHTRLQDKAVIKRLDAVDAVKLLEQKNYTFDIIFCDPPYHKGLCQKLLDTLNTSNILADKCLFIAEIGKDEKLNSDNSNFELLRSKTYGATTKINIYKYIKGIKS